MVQRRFRVIDLYDLIAVRQLSERVGDRQSVSELRHLLRLRQRGATDGVAEPEETWNVPFSGKIATQTLVVVGLGLLAAGLGFYLSWWLADWLGHYWTIRSGHECLAALLLIIVTLVGFWYSITTRIRPIIAERTGRLQGLCHVCGYDLTGNVSRVCPECGTPVRNDLRRPPASDANDGEDSKPRFL